MDSGSWFALSASPVGFDAAGYAWRLAFRRARFPFHGTSCETSPS